MGVTLLCDVVYIVCHESSTIIRFNAITHERLTDINVKDLRQPYNIVACESTSQLYVADFAECIWRVSSDGTDIKRQWTKSSSDKFMPFSLSLVSSRLLVTSHKTKELMQLKAVDELRRIHLPNCMFPYHAVESPTGTFLTSHFNTQLNKYQISEVNTEGELLRQFSRSAVLGWIPHIAADSHGNIFVADRDNRRVLLLDANLALRRVIIDEDQLKNEDPEWLCYNEQSGQLLVGLRHSVAVFDVRC